MRFFLGTEERVRNSRGKRAISVRATDFLLYFESTKGEGSVPAFICCVPDTVAQNRRCPTATSLGYKKIHSHDKYIHVSSTTWRDITLSHPLDKNIPFYRCLRFFYPGLLSKPRLFWKLSQFAHHYLI